MTPQTSKHRVALFALALGAIGPASTGVVAQESPSQLEAPAAVYEIVLDALGERHDVLIVDEVTRPCSMHPDALSTIPGPRGEALRDCAAKEVLEFGVDVERLSPSMTILPLGALEDPYVRSKASLTRPVVTMSRPGISRDSSTMIIEAWFVCGTMCGSIELFTFARRAEVWELEKQTKGAIF